MTASLKMRQLESKISGLQQQYKLLLEERQQEIAGLLTTLDLAHLDDKTLTGSLLFLKEKITTQDPIVEAWHVAGEKFLRRTKPARYTTSKQTGAPQATHQSPQKQPQPREK